MPRQIIKSLLVTLVIISPVFADDTLSTFNQQGDINYPEPIGEESYFATKAPMESKISGYFGADLGIGLTSLRPEVRVNSVINNTGEFQKKNAMNYALGLHGGLGTNFSHFYIGSELSLAFNLLNKNFTGNVKGCNTKLSVKQPLVASIDIIPGYLNEARDLLFYGRLGVGTRLIRLTFKDLTNSVEDGANKFSLGWRAGLGMEYFMSDSFSIRTEYIYSRYKKVESNYMKSGYQYDYKLEPQGTNQVNLGLTIYF